MLKKTSRGLLLFLLFTMPMLAEYGDYRYESVDTAPPARTVPAKQVILQNRKSIAALKRQIAEQGERIDGLISLIEGMNAEIADLRMGTSVSGGPAASDKDENTALLKELGVMIDKINANYVSKEELARALKGSYSPATSQAEKRPSIEESLQSQENSKLYSEGVRLFVKKRYDEAQKRFQITDKKGYKPAASNYYLGEIAYYTKRYEDAIFYFKKSAGLYDQASYIDVLLLHTAISLEKTGDKAQAKIFYKNIIANYPDRKSAKIAKEKLKKL